jgi:hypothetical protein
VPLNVDDPVAISEVDPSAVGESVAVAPGVADGVGVEPTEDDDGVTHSFVAGATSAGEGLADGPLDGVAEEVGLAGTHGIPSPFSDSDGLYVVEVATICASTRVTPDGEYGNPRAVSRTILETPAPGAAGSGSPA